MKALMVYTLLATLSFPLITKAEDMSLPVVSKPSILEEGTQRELTAAQIAELLPWAKDSKLFLTDLLDNIQGLSISDQIERLSEGLEQVVGDSSSKHSELLMRYALNRGLVINKILSKEIKEDTVGFSDVKLRVLRSSILMALKYYETDMAVLSKKVAAPYVLFGLEYYSFLTELNKSVIDASAQYAIQRTALEWLQWDLYRDLNNAAYATQIVKINNALKSFPTAKLSDAQSLAYIRQMKKIALQLTIPELLQKVSRTAPSSEVIPNRSEEQVEVKVDRNERYDNSPIRVGDKVTTNDHYTAIVKQIFPDGLVTIQMGSSTYNYNISNLYKPIDCLKNLCVGDKVVTNDHYTAIIKQVFPDGLITIQMGSSTYNYNVGNLYKFISCLKDFCAGDKVTTNDHYSAVIKQMFPDGLVTIQMGSSTYNYNIGNLYKPIDSLKGFNVGDEITTNDHYNAVIKQIFPDGLVTIQMGSSTYSYNIGNLYKKINCLKDICAGDTVTTNDHYTATVKQIFPDGLVSIQMGSSTYSYNIGNLYKAQ